MDRALEPIATEHVGQQHRAHPNASARHSPAGGPTHGAFAAEQQDRHLPVAVPPAARCSESPKLLRRRRALSRFALRRPGRRFVVQNRQDDGQPTTTSQAATTMVKNAIIWASRWPCMRAKVTNARLTEHELDA